MLRFPMTACPVIQDNSYPLVQSRLFTLGTNIAQTSDVLTLVIQPIQNNIQVGAAINWEELT